MTVLPYQDFAERIVDSLALGVAELPLPTAGLFDDLGFDSFQAVELLVTAEELSQAQVADIEPPEIYTMQDAYDYYCNLSRQS